MKVKDLLSRLRGDRQIKITYQDKMISSFDGQFWKTIAPEVLDLMIRDVGLTSNGLMIRVATGIPVVVSSVAELKAAIKDESIEFIALGADIDAEEGDEATMSVVDISQQKTLDLKGHVISAPVNKTGDPTVKSYGIYVSGAKLDIFDSDDGGGVVGLTCSAVVYAGNKAKVNIHSGDYVGGYLNGDGSCVIYADEGAEVTLYDGYYKNQVYAEGEIVKNLVLAEAEELGIICEGGLYVEQDPTKFVNSYTCMAEAVPDTDPVVYRVRKVLGDD